MRKITLPDPRVENFQFRLRKAFHIMLSEIPAVAASLRSFAELTTLIMKAKVDAAVKEKAVELNSVLISVQGSLLTMQSEYQSLLQAKDELEKRLVAMENWEAESANYELREISPGTFVYVFKGDQAIFQAPPLALRKLL